MLERANAAAAAHARDPSLKNPKQPKKSAPLESAEYEVFTITSRRCTIPELRLQLEIRGVMIKMAREKRWG
jgi:hypothetical protein